METMVTTNKGNKYVIWESVDGFRATSYTNYKRYIMNANEVLHFTKSAFWFTLDEVQEYLVKWC